MTDRELDEKVAILLGWSPPGSETSRQHYQKRYSRPGETIQFDKFQGYWIDPKGRAFRRTKPPSYSTDVAAFERDVLPHFASKLLKIEKDERDRWIVLWVEGEELKHTQYCATIPRAGCEAFVAMKEEG